MKRIPYGTQDVNEEDIQAVLKVLHSDWLTQGPTISQFEETVAKYCGSKYAVAVCNATSALHLACLVAGLSSGNTLWTSPNTFVASANCGLYCEAKVDFVDIDLQTYNISVEALKVKLEWAEKNGKLPKVLIPVHFAGQSCEMSEIHSLAKKYGFLVIEDATHAIGGSYLDKKIGSCAFSDMTIFSFHPVKIITTGEGGMILTNNKEYYEKLIRLRSHGISRDTNLMQGSNHGPWYYQQIDLGFNYRITDFQAALGISQIKRLDEFVSRRHFLANRYNLELSNLPVRLPYQNPHNYSAYHLYVIRLELDKIKKSKREVFEELQLAGINVNVHYIPVHTQPYYQKLGFKLGGFPNSEKYYQEAITIPLYSRLSDEDQEYVIRKLQESLKKSSS